MKRTTAGHFISCNLDMKGKFYMANFVYKLTTQKAMKIAGVIDTDAMIVEIDGEDKKLSTLLKEFNGSSIELNVKIKNEEELAEPEDDSDDEE